MPKRTAECFELQREIATKFKAAIEQRYSSVAEAADDLQTSRQRLHSYLNAEAIPQADLLLKAMKIWGLTIECFGVAFSFTPLDEGTEFDYSQQLLLFPQLTPEGKKEPATETRSALPQGVSQPNEALHLSRS